MMRNFNLFVFVGLAFYVLPVCADDLRYYQFFDLRDGGWIQWAFYSYDDPAIVANNYGVPSVPYYNDDWTLGLEEVGEDSYRELVDWGCYSPYSDDPAYSSPVPSGSPSGGGSGGASSGGGSDVPSFFGGLDSLVSGLSLGAGALFLACAGAVSSFVVYKKFISCERGI